MVATHARAVPRYVLSALSGLAALLVGIGLGRFGYAPFIPVLVERGWFTAPQAALLGATNLAGYILGVGAARRLALRWAPSAVVRGALLVSVASFVGCAWPLGFGWYFAWRLASGAAGGIVMVLATPLLLSLAPPERRGRVGGLLITGVGAGTALAGLLIPGLARSGLRAAWLTLAVLAAASSALAWVGLPRGAPARTEAAAPSQRAHLTWPVARLMVAYASTGVGFVPHTVFWVDYIARGLGRGLAVGGQSWTQLGLAAAVGPLLLGLLAERIGFSVCFRLTLFAMMAGVGLPAISSHPFALAVSAVCVGITAIGIVALGAGRVSELVPAEHQHQVWGWTTLLFSLAYAATAYAFSLVFAVTGSYRLLFGIGAAALLGGGALDALGSIHDQRSRARRLADVGPLRGRS